MVRYNNASVLRRLDLDNVDKLKIIMNILLSALEAQSTEIPDADTTDVVLYWWEREWIKTVLKAVDRNTDYHLLKGAIVRFCAARQESQARVETAVHELETLADEDVLMVPETHMAEYTEALRRFEALPRSASQRLLEEAFIAMKEMSNKRRSVKRGDAKDQNASLCSQPQPTTKRTRPQEEEEEGSQDVEKLDAKKPKCETKEYKPRGPSACTTCRQAKVRVPLTDD
ncbi:hypothetical protein OIDMADRAFT_54035 [Oidiodendron maius Zn]|uniref:Uncharacterized protein n=1 Tax=Oidiodendron maius (strain Zn) TaxID=913774 RepID=A0A0C3HCG7_OIDMZ|nr:hypothetical protein OIDMADRAFT_54035 [Oidiodendron maius Zn]